jgi:hypothetical protein
LIKCLYSGLSAKLKKSDHAYQDELRVGVREQRLEDVVVGRRKDFRVGRYYYCHFGYGLLCSARDCALLLLIYIMRGGF